jgi:membrane protein YqaA with SNARE-associated domain
MNFSRPLAIQQFATQNRPASRSSVQVRAAFPRLAVYALTPMHLVLNPSAIPQATLPNWLQKLVATMGGGGLAVVAFLDSSVLTFPFVADALVIELSRRRPALMPYYAAMAALGSLAGCIWLYLLAKKGGEAYFRHRHGHLADRVKGWVDANAFLSVFVPGILPPPFPFKVFVLAEGVFQVPLRTFVLALVCGRCLRYFAEGLLGVRYGEAVIVFMKVHTAAFALACIGVLLALYLAGRLLVHHPRKG